MSPQEAWPVVSLVLMAAGFWMGWDLGRKREKIAQLEARIDLLAGEAKTIKDVG